MGKRRHGAPNRFGEGGGFSTVADPVDAAITELAVQRFVKMFVTAVKRERALLLMGRRRIEGLQRLSGWIEARYETVLEGADGFPQRLQERYGDLQGVLVDHGGGRRTTIAGAVWAAAGGFGALFVADDGHPRC